MNTSNQDLRQMIESAIVRFGEIDAPMSIELVYQVNGKTRKAKMFNNGLTNFQKRFWGGWQTQQDLSAHAETLIDGLTNNYASHLDLSSELSVLATQLPTFRKTGAFDPVRAGVRLTEERQERDEYLAINDQLGALLECADMLYCAIQMGDDSYLNTLVECESYFNRMVIEQAAIAKYTYRAQQGNPKNDEVERGLVAPLLEAQHDNPTP